MIFAKIRPALKGAFVSFFSWSFGYYGVLVIGQGLGAVSNYALIAGWWFVAYVSSVFFVPILSGLILAVFYFVLFIISVLIGHSWFYRDVLSLNFMSAIAIGLVQAFFIASPVLFNWIFKKFYRAVKGVDTAG